MTANVKFFDWKAGDFSTHTRMGISPNQELTNELQRPIIRKFKKRKQILLLKVKFGVLISETCNS